jgi:hypothetical protein
LDKSLDLAETQTLPNWLRLEIWSRTLAEVLRPLSRFSAFEDDFAAPAREITSRHGVDKRSLLSLGAA